MIRSAPPVLALLVASATLASPASAASGSPPASPPAGIHKIKHVVVIMQENRSFDSYFGTYPGADGIPMRNGMPAVCAPDPLRGRCVAPYHDGADVNHGGPHGEAAAFQDIAGGAMNGFVAAAQSGKGTPCKNQQDPVCTIPGETDVMGYHDGGELADAVDIALVVGGSTTARIQECHILIAHVVCDLVERALE